MKNSVYSLLNHIDFKGDIWDCCARTGILSKELSILLPQDIISSDLSGIFGCKFDFLSEKNKLNNPFNIITQPPLPLCYLFLDKAFDITDTGKKIAFFLPNLLKSDVPSPDLMIRIDKNNYKGWSWFVWKKT